MNEPKSFLVPLGGYVLDLIAKMRNQIFVPHSLTKLHNIRTCRRLSGATTVVEIGSYKGVTTHRLARMFERVVSVEIDEVLFEVARERCKNLDNVEMICGDGSKILPELSPKLDRALIFLDGHFSGGETSFGDEPEPVLVELDVVARHLDRYCAIVVDDFRLFGVEEGWPKKSEVFAKLEAILDGEGWTISLLNDQVLAYRPK